MPKFYVIFARKMTEYYIIIVSGVAGRGGLGVWTRPELPSGVHAKRKYPVRIFFVRRGGVGG